MEKNETAGERYINTDELKRNSEKEKFKKREIIYRIRNS